MQKNIVITGITGMDGSILSRQLLAKGHHVFGLARRSSDSPNLRCAEGLQNDPNFEVVEGDLTDLSSLCRLVKLARPHEVYNLAAMSHVGTSFKEPIHTAQVTGLGVLNLLEAVRLSDVHSRFYQACHDVETKVVTPDGIKEYISLKEGDLVYSLNEETHQIELRSITKIHEYDYNGKMVSLLGKRIDQLVTPNHKVLLKSDDDEIVKIDASNVKGLFDYERISNLSLPYVKGLDENHEIISILDIVECEEISKIGGSRYKNLVTEIEAKDLLYILGLYIGDGYHASAYRTSSITFEEKQLLRDEFGKYISVTKKDVIKKVKSSTMLFALPRKDPAREKLISILDKYNISYTEQDLTITFSSLPLSKVMRLSGGKVYDKHIPDFVYKFPSLLSYLLEGIVDSDGHIRKTKDGERFCITTSSSQLASQVLALALQCGRYASLHKVTDHKNEIYENGKIRIIKSTCPSYYINISEGIKNKLYKYMCNEEDYSGKVWCLEIKDNHNFLIIRNGKIAISGNSTSELIGGVSDVPSNEETPFYPKSPYGCAKLFGYWITRNYRESYRMFASNGVLFNHETLTYCNPLIFRGSDGLVDILPIGDIARFHSGVIFDMSQTSGIQGGTPIVPLEVWDQNGWTKVKFVSGYPHQGDKDPKIVNARSLVYSGTGSHVCIMENGEKATSDIQIGDRVATIEYPCVSEKSTVSLEEAEFLGMLVGDGNVSQGIPRLTNKDLKLKERFVYLWSTFTGSNKVTFNKSNSGFTGEFIGSVSCQNVDHLKFDVYCEDISPFGHRAKKIPKKILNSSKEVMKAFLDGYNACDGLKKNKCTYLYKNFKTNSMTLAAGLLYLVSKVTGQRYNLTVEKSDAWRKTQYYYSINLLSLTSNVEKEISIRPLIEAGISQREISRRTGISRTFIRKIQRGGHGVINHHRSRSFNEVKKVISLDSFDGWFFDLETESGTFHAGIGQGVLHNSTCRGPNFVTRKITLGIRAIKDGVQDKLYLGNLDARRDWGWAPDFTQGMELILNHHEPDDFVLATGETHSVREFCEEAFSIAGLGDYKQYVEVDPRFFRPSEVNVLIGDYSKAKRLLGWEPTTTFKELVSNMVLHDLK